MIDLEQIIYTAVRDAVADHLKQHPLTMPTTEPEAENGDKEDNTRYYTRKQAAEVAQISLPTIHELHNEGLVEFIKIGRNTRIPADKFDADLAAGKFSNLRHKRRMQPGKSFDELNKIPLTEELFKSGNNHFYNLVYYSLEIRTVGELCCFKLSEFMKVRNFGRKSRYILDDFMEREGLNYGMFDKHIIPDYDSRFDTFKYWIGK